MKIVMEFDMSSEDDRALYEEVYETARRNSIVVDEITNELRKIRKHEEHDKEVLAIVDRLSEIINQ